MRNKLVKYSLGVSSAVTLVFLGVSRAFADASSTLSNATNALDNLEAMLWTYVNLGITKVWPLFLILGIVAAVIGILVALYHHFTARKAG